MPPAESRPGSSGLGSAPPLTDVVGVAVSAAEWQNVRRNATMIRGLTNAAMREEFFWCSRLAKDNNHNNEYGWHQEQLMDSLRSIFENAESLLAGFYKVVVGGRGVVGWGVHVPKESCAQGSKLLDLCFDLNGGSLPKDFAQGPLHKQIKNCETLFLFRCEVDPGMI